MTVYETIKIDMPLVMRSSHIKKIYNLTDMFYIKMSFE